MEWFYVLNFRRKRVQSLWAYQIACKRGKIFCTRKYKRSRTKMKAFAVDEVHNTLEDPTFRAVELDLPHVGEHDVLMEVKAISVNPLDVKRRMLAPVLESQFQARVLGWDASGLVTRIGEKVSLFKVGDEVYCAGEITRAGSYAQYLAVDEHIVGHKPRTLSFERSAALALTSITAWEGLFERLRIKPNFESIKAPVAHPDKAQNRQKSILIIGGAGGVGSMAIQLAKHVAGLHVVATASRAQSVQWCKDLGAHEVVDHTRDLVEQVRALGLKFVDHVFILNDSDQHFDAACELLAPQGLICSIVPNQRPLNMDALRAKSAGLVWEGMFVRSKERTEDMLEQHHLLNEVSRLVDLGVLKDTSTQVYSPIHAQHLRQAHLDLQTHRTIGKIVLAGFE